MPVPEVTATPSQGLPTLPHPPDPPPPAPPRRPPRARWASPPRCQRASPPPTPCGRWRRGRTWTMCSWCAGASSCPTEWDSGSCCAGCQVRPTRDFLLFRQSAVCTCADVPNEMLGLRFGGGGGAPGRPAWQPPLPARVPPPLPRCADACLVPFCLQRPWRRCSSRRLRPWRLAAQQRPTLQRRWQSSARRCSCWRPFAAATRRRRWSCCTSSCQRGLPQRAGSAAQTCCTLPARRWQCWCSYPSRPPPSSVRARGRRGASARGRQLLGWRASARTPLTCHPTHPAPAGCPQLRLPAATRATTPLCHPSLPPPLPLQATASPSAPPWRRASPGGWCTSCYPSAVCPPPWPPARQRWRLARPRRSPC